MITIVNYDMGNLRSVCNALDYLGIRNEVVCTPEKILNAKKLLLPGVGSYRKAMETIKTKGFYDVITKKVIKDNTPILGICLGMQLLAKGSEEDGFTEGFGFIDDTAVKFDIDKAYLVPHVGFNEVKINPNNATLFDNTDCKTDFYFTHSYHLKDTTQPFVSGICNYGKDFTAVFEQGNIFGTQFHPEKSQSNGLKILINFSNI